MILSILFEKTDWINTHLDQPIRRGTRVLAVPRTSECGSEIKHSKINEIHVICIVKATYILTSIVAYTRSYYANRSDYPA